MANLITITNSGLTIQTNLTITDGLTLATVLSQLQISCEDILVLVNDTYCKIYNSAFPGELTHTGSAGEYYHFKDHSYTYTVFGSKAANKFYPALDSNLKDESSVNTPEVNNFTLICESEVLTITYVADQKLKVRSFL